ncbi:MAG: response regulator, partial [Chloroflexales bacterium]|nr:response regulator [Chloroflexales bacterium]
PLTLDAILETLLDVLQQLLPYDSANIMLPDGANGFRVRHWRGYERWTDPALLTALVFDPTQRPLIHAIVTAQRSVLVLDTHQEPSWTPMLGTDHIRCWLGVPLIAGNTVVGIYSIDRQHPHTLTDADVRLAETLAATAATAIERAQLIAQVQGEWELLAQRVAERTADLSLANAELAHAARLKDEFLANMSHELRTPLNTILGRSELLREQIYGPLSEKQAQAITSIDASGRHLLSLINDILDLSKVEAGKVELQLTGVDVDLVCQQSRQLVVERATRKRIALSTTLDPQVTTVTADELRLKQILANLLTNAVKFTPEGGQVGLEVEGDPERQAATFTVWDTGIGIAPEDQGRLFQPFVQLDSALNREHTGTGLGLALVLRLAELHGGSVALESTPGQGSRFSVRLPWVQALVEHRPSHASPEASAPLAALIAEGIVAQPLILLAEDHEENSQLLSDILTAAGYRVVVARNGVEAVALAEDLRPALILMDIQMPVLDGLEATRRLRAAGMRATPIIALTALTMRGDRERCLEAGANEYLSKPVSLRALLTLIATQLRGTAPDAGGVP